MADYFTKNSHFKLIIMLSLLIICSFSTLAIGGENSIIAPLANRSLLLDVQSVEDVLIAVGERGHILISEDSGSSWNQVQVPTRATLTGVYFIDRQNGWVVGHDQIILRTRDGGKNWELVYENAESESPLLDVYFLDAEHGYAIGAYGQFLETFDAGSSWKGRWISEDDFHLNKITAIGSQLYIAAEAGFVYRSDDGGKNWIGLSPDYEGSFFGILPLGNSSLLLFGLRGNLFRSDNAGEDWVKISTVTEASLTDGIRLNDGSLVISGLAGAFLISRDNGHNFSLYQDPDRKGVSSLLQTPDGDIVAVGDFGVTKLPQFSINN